MRKKIFIIFILSLFLLPLSAIQAGSLSTRLSGRIVLQAEGKGEAWYIDPVTNTRIFLGRPADAFRIMRERGLGVSNTDFEKFQNSVPAKFSGRILLQVDMNGEAWYVNPMDLKMYFLGRPADAFAIMRRFGLGISNADIIKIREYGTEKEGSILQEVPFTSQAPFGGWSDIRQEDGCEEASSLMAVSWARGESLTPTKALKTILAISDYEKKNYGGFEDTSAFDTVERIIKGYFDYQNVVVKNNVNLKDIKSEILAGNLVLVPANGRALGNPYFTQPGPPIHMLVIKGYDADTHEFITNEPGTRHGESYRYNEDVLFDAIRDYPTGNHLPIEGEKKDVIVVWK